MGCGGSKGTTVVESHVNINGQRHDSIKRPNDVIGERVSIDKKVDDTGHNGGNAVGRHPVKANEGKLHAVNDHNAVNEHTTGLGVNHHTDQQGDETDGRKSHSSETRKGQKHKLPIQRHQDVAESKSVNTKVSQAKEEQNEEKRIVSAKNKKPSSTKDDHHGGNDKGREIKTTAPVKGNKKQLLKDDQDVTKTALRQKPSHDINRDLKTESLFDPSVNVEKYRKDPIPVFGRGAFPLSKDHPDLTVEDTFWPGKRALIPDYSKMKKLDKHAIETPSRLRKDMGKLVAHLTKVANSEFEKLRVVFRWVAHNIEYNVQGFKTGNLGDNSAEGVLRSGLSVCDGYSNLVSAMCAKAGVECEKVNGYAKGSGYEPGKENLTKQAHSWNKVTLGGQTYLCDCTWAAGSVGNVYTRSWKEEEFLVEPGSFANSHIPRDLTSQDTSPYNSREEWNNTPVFGRAAPFTGLECLTHKEGIIKASDNTCLVKIKLERALYNTFCLIENEDHKKIKGVVQHWWNGNELSCSIRLPKAGRYTFMILGSVSSQRTDNDNTEILYPEHPNDAIGNNLVTYVIKATGSEKNKPMSSDENSIGLFGGALDLPNYGLTPASENQATIQAVAGSAHVVFKKLHQGTSSIIVELYKFGDQNKKLTSSVYCEQFDEWVVCHVRCPSDGRYTLIMYVKSLSEAHSCHVRYTVVSKGTFDSLSLPDMKGVSGPNSRFAEIGLRLEGALTTTLLTSEGEGELIISCDASKETKIIADLKDVSGATKNDGSYVVEKNKWETEQVTTVSLRFKQKGFFKLTLFAKDGSMPKHEYIGHWLVVCRKPSKKDPYPVGATDIGPASDFHSLGLQTTTQSRVVCDKGEGTIEVFSKPKSHTEFIFSLSRAKEDELEGQIFADTFVTDGKRITRFHFRMNKIGTFAFRLFAKSKGGAGQHAYVGIWLVVNDSVCKKQGYPGRKIAYGPNAVFWDSGLDIDDSTSKRLELAHGKGELCLTHKPGTNRRITAHLETAGGKRLDQSSVSLLIEGTWSDKGNIASTRLRLRLKKPGVYDLVIFAENEKGNSFTFAGVWLVDCSKATAKTAFPDIRGTMGPGQKFFQMGLSAKASFSSTLPADAGGLCTLQVFRKKPFGVIFKESHKKCQVSVTKSESEKYSFTCDVKLPSPGLYTLDMFASEPEEKTKDFMGKWLLEWNKK